MKNAKLAAIYVLGLLIVVLTGGCIVVNTETSINSNNVTPVPVMITEDDDTHFDEQDEDTHLPKDPDADTSEHAIGKPELEDPGDAANGFGDPLDLFEDQLKRAISRRDYDELASLMSDTFGFALWLSEGYSSAPDQAVESLRNTYLPEDAEIQFPEQPDVSALFPEGNVLKVWNPEVNPIRTIFITGWGADGAGEVFLIIVDMGDGDFAWGGMLYAGEGFTGN